MGLDDDQFKDFTQDGITVARDRRANARILDIANKYGVAIPVAGAMLLSIDKGEKAIEGGRKDI